MVKKIMDRDEKRNHLIQSLFNAATSSFPNPQIAAVTASFQPEHVVRINIRLMHATNSYNAVPT